MLNTDAYLSICLIAHNIKPSQYRKEFHKN